MININVIYKLNKIPDFLNNNLFLLTSNLYVDQLRNPKKKGSYKKDGSKEVFRYKSFMFDNIFNIY